ncbi:PREDICTED: SAGA-associated factor 29 homolog [Gekko japonicus]|uniref:SAGA-associated factor 29 homolog n=1 Tax=Gekko japonicus TaxID=146911 RepID=A0ABM1K4M9_GEKJA|nr:PREDICTED: SAGA-associated factor 29 homolog [Gekko japonicus]
MALVSADSRIAELLGELHQLIKQTQEERSRSEHNLVNIQKTHERMQTENKISPYYRTKLRGLYTTAKADAEAECNILRKALDKIAEIKSLLEERRIGMKRHTLSRRRIIPLPQWKANPETDPEALFQKDQLVLALYPQTTCFYRALIHTPPQRPQDDYSVLFEDTSYADGYSPPLNVAQRYVVACKETKKK